MIARPTSHGLRALGLSLALAAGAASCASDGGADDVTATSVAADSSTSAGSADTEPAGLDTDEADAAGADAAGAEAAGADADGDAAATGGSDPDEVESAPDEQASGDAAAGESTGVQPAGFGFVGARITEPDGEVCEVCLWLAETPEQRGRGLMGVTDLGPAAGMAFVFPGLITGAFYMFQTPTPLEIHWVGPGGDIVGAAVMEPCLDQPAADCARYRPADAYTIAIETFIGGAAEIGLGADSIVELIDPATVCPTG